MSTTPLSTNFKDDILASSNAKRKYQITYNDDGTISLDDVTQYSQTGSEYGAKEVNEERTAINNIDERRIVTLDEIDLVTEEGYFVDAKAVAELNSKSEWKSLGTAKSGDFVSFPDKWSEIICFCNVKNGTNTNTVSIHVPNFPALLSSGAYLSGSAYVASSDNCFARVKLSSSGLTPQSAYKDNGNSLVATYSIYYR